MPECVLCKRRFELDARREQRRNNAVRHYWVPEVATWQSNKGFCVRRGEESSIPAKVGRAPTCLESVIGTHGVSTTTAV
jgi:hypothetical protein